MTTLMAGTGDHPGNVGLNLFVHEEEDEPLPRPGIREVAAPSTGMATVSHLADRATAV